MSVFTGGSAYSMARDIAEGFILVNERTFRKYSPKEIADFSQEANRLLQEVRADRPGLEDTAATLKRRRRLQRLQQAIGIASGARGKRA